jgi:hypothetical protein
VPIADGPDFAGAAFTEPRERLIARRQRRPLGDAEGRAHKA